MKNFSFMDFLQKVPGGMMLAPLILGSLVKTFFPGFLELGSFTTALFKSSAMPLIALLIVATGSQINMKQSTGVLARTGALLLAKTLIPGLLAILYGVIFGKAGIFGFSLLVVIIAFMNSNGGLWLALTGQYGNVEDQGAYIASGLNDGPFFALLFLGLSGLGAIPWIYIVSAIIPFLVGFILGNLDNKFAVFMKPAISITIPYFAFSLGAVIDLRSLITGGISGLILGIMVSIITGGLGFLAYKIFFKKNQNPGVGFAIGTTAGNSLASVVVVAAADASFEPYVAVASAQIAAAFLVTAILTPIITHYLCKKYMVVAT